MGWASLRSVVSPSLVLETEMLCWISRFECVVNGKVGMGCNAFERDLLI